MNVLTSKYYIYLSSSLRCWVKITAIIETTTRTNLHKVLSKQNITELHRVLIIYRDFLSLHVFQLTLYS